jgi:hypothetical protein
MERAAHLGMREIATRTSGTGRGVTSAPSEAPGECHLETSQRYFADLLRPALAFVTLTVPP